MPYEVVERLWYKWCYGLYAKKGVPYKTHIHCTILLFCVGISAAWKMARERKREICCYVDPNRSPLTIRFRCRKLQKEGPHTWEREGERESITLDTPCITMGHVMLYGIPSTYARHFSLKFEMWLGIGIHHCAIQMKWKLQLMMVNLLACLLFGLFLSTISPV